MSQFPIEDALKSRCDELRMEIHATELQVRELHMHAHDAAEKVGRSNSIGEVYANVMLAVRHLEDARMRLGKVLQHARDGVSIYDQPPKEPTP